MAFRLRQSRFFNRAHGQHYGALILASWGLAALLIFPALQHPPAYYTGWRGLIITAPTFAAHLYALRALIGLRRIGDFKPNMMAALMTLSYIPAFFISLSFAPLKDALILPAIGVYMAVISFGLFLPGASLLLAYGLNVKIVKPHMAAWRMALAAALFIGAWVLSGFGARVMSAI